MVLRPGAQTWSSDLLTVSRTRCTHEGCKRLTRPGFPLTTFFAILFLVPTSRDIDPLGWQGKTLVAVWPVVGWCSAGRIGVPGVGGQGADVG